MQRHIKVRTDASVTIRLLIPIRQLAAMTNWVIASARSQPVVLIPTRTRGVAWWCKPSQLR